MKKIIITFVLFTISISVIIAQDIDVISQEKDTITTQSEVLNVEKKDSIIQDQAISQKDIIEIKEGLNQLLTAQLIGFEQVMIDAKKKANRGLTGGIRTSLASPIDRYEYAPLEIRFNFGYDISDRLFLSFLLDYSFGLFHDKTFDANIALGGEIGYDILKTKIGNLDLRAAVLTTITGGKEKIYKYTSYEAGVYWHNGLKTDMLMQTIGFGIKYYDSKTNFLPNSWCIFFSFGYSF